MYQTIRVRLATVFAVLAMGSSRWSVLKLGARIIGHQLEGC